MCALNFFLSFSKENFYRDAGLFFNDSTAENNINAHHHIRYFVQVTRLEKGNVDYMYYQEPERFDPPTVQHTNGMRRYSA